MSEVLIHPAAIVSPGAKLGVGVSVGAFSYIGPNVTIGDNTRVSPHVVIDGHTTIGANNQIFQFASLGSAPQDLKFNNEPSTLTIGERNVIREYVTLQPGTAHGTMKTIIGSGNLFMGSSHVAHDCRVGDNNVFANSVALAGHVEVGSGVIIGGLVGVHQFVRVGDLAFLGAGAMVDRDVPPFAMAQGDRCHLRGLNLIGLRRAGFSLDEVNAIKRTFRALFWQPGSAKDHLAALPKELTERPLSRKIVQFVESTKRGITPARHIARLSREEEETLAPT